MLLFRGRARSIHQNKNSRRKYTINMCSGRIMPKMLLFAIPVMLTSILQLLFNAADIIVVGRFAGDNSLAAVGSNSSLIGLMTNLFVGISIGTNVLVSRYFGSKNDEGISKAVSTSILVAIFSGIFLTILGVVFARKILILMHTPAEVLGLATLYLVIYFFGMTPMMIYNFGAAVLRASGDTRRPLFYLSVAGVINVILNLFFVIYLHLDVAGVAIATVISQCVSAALVLRCLSRETGPMRLTLKGARIDLENLLKILRIGIPAGLQGVLFSFSNVVIQSSINTFGATVMAGSSASDNIETFVYFSMEAFYQATISFTSQNMGAGKVDRVYKVLKTGMICSVVTGIAFGLAVVLFSHQLLGIYTTSEARQNGRHRKAAHHHPDIRPLRPHGGHGRRNARHRLLRAPDRRHAPRRLRLPRHLGRRPALDPGLPLGHNRLRLVPRLLGADLRRAPRMLPLGQKARAVEVSGEGRVIGGKGTGKDINIKEGFVGSDRRSPLLRCVCF